MVLNVIAMGGVNAVDVAHQTHVGVLRESGGMNPSEVLEYGKPIPRGGVLQALYIDDHVVCSVVPKSDQDNCSGRDFDLVCKSHEGYERAKLDASTKKAFGFAKGLHERAAGGISVPKADTSFLAWGTHVRSDPGRAEVPINVEACFSVLLHCSSVASGQGPQECVCQIYCFMYSSFST